MVMNICTYIYRYQNTLILVNTIQTIVCLCEYMSIGLNIFRMTDIKYKLKPLLNCSDYPLTEIKLSNK